MKKSEDPKGTPSPIKGKQNAGIQPWLVLKPGQLRSGDKHTPKEVYRNTTGRKRYIKL